MTHSDRSMNDRGNEWQDRVAGKDEPLGAASIDLNDLLNDAADLARTAVECVAVPLREVLAGLPAAISFETWGAPRSRAEAAAAACGARVRGSAVAATPERRAPAGKLMR